MVITLTGSNSFQLRRRLDDLARDFADKYGDLAIERIDAAEVDLGTVLAAVSSLPFLSQRKMVVLREGAGSKQIAEAIEQIINSTSENTDLVILEPLTDKRTIYYKTLRANTQFEEFSDLDNRDLAKWLVAEANRLGAELSLGNANYLVDRVGTNQAILAQELEKLAQYEPDISRPSIDELIAKSPQSKIFDLLDASFAGNVKDALRLYEEQRAQNVEPQAIMALLAWQLQLIAVAKAAPARPAAEIAAEAKISPYPLSKAMSLASKTSNEKLRAMINEAAQIDLKSKTVYLDMDEALKTYITSL